MDGYYVASNNMALKLVIDAGKLNRAGDARGVRDGRVWSATGG